MIKTREQVGVATLTYKTITLKLKCYHCEGWGHKITDYCRYCYNCNVCDGKGYVTEDVEVVDTEQQHWRLPEVAMRDTLDIIAKEMDRIQGGSFSERKAKREDKEATKKR